MTTLICDCNQTMPLAPTTLGAALNEKLTLHSALCRREVGAFVKAVQGGDDLVVACTQESRLFSELAADNQSSAPIRFVNIRETGGWSREADKSSPKMAALLALAHLPEPEPVATVTYKSAGKVLIIGALDAAERAAALLSDTLDVTVFSTGAGDQGGAQARLYPVLSGEVVGLTGYLGAFELQWQRSNPIDLDLCTRCNACVAACPSQAIGLDYQIDLQICDNSRQCVKVCTVAGAINFQQTPQVQRDSFDLVIDLRGAPAFSQHALPQGYFLWNGTDLSVLLKARDLVGEFEKPKFFNYKQKICAHSRNDKVGCSACIDVCSALAISSDFKRQQVKVNPNLCVGCGACSTVCPTGAMSFAYPRAADFGVRLKTLLSTYTRAGGKDAALLLHSQEAGAQLLNDLGRAAQLEKRSKTGIHGLPARVVPMPVWHTASTGVEVWLSAFAYGANQVWVLMTGEEAPQYQEALQTQINVAQEILTGLGYAGSHFRLLKVEDMRDLSALDTQLQAVAAQGVGRSAGFALQTDKRATLDLVLEHLIANAPAIAKTPDMQAISLPAKGSPFGALVLDKDACTLCLSCINACPAAALSDNEAAPQLKFVEKNCVQCGLCVSTCPEKALSLLPRLNLTPKRKEAVLLNEMQPYACVRCSRPFGTLKAIEAMVGKLAGHAMFQGAALERLKMCGDCRVIDLHSATNEIKITDL